MTTAKQPLWIHVNDKIYLPNPDAPGSFVPAPAEAAAAIAALEAPDAGVVAELVEALREARLMVNTNTQAGKLWDDNARALIAKLETRA